jgi:serine/threonine protein phosphatase PrpC
MKIYSHSLQGKRPSNEDQHFHILNLNGSNKDISNINLIGVCDGHGGSAVSKYLKNVLPSILLNRKYKKNYYNNEAAQKYIIDIFNKVQLNLKSDHPRLANRCGSTCCLGIHYIDDSNNHKILVVNVGDSRAVKCNRNGKAEQLTEDHKPNSKNEKYRITQLGGKIIFDGVDWRINDLSLSRAFGDLDAQPHVTHVPQIYNYKLSTYDKFIIFACDGLWDVVSNQDAVNYISKLSKTNPHCNYAKELAEYAIAKGSLDNVTVIIYSFY